MVARVEKTPIPSVRSPHGVQRSGFLLNGEGELRAGHIFISYRRSDSADIAGRIYDRLTGRFGRNPIFKDVDSIPLGLDFKEFLDAKVSECSVLLAIIGDRWLEAIDELGERRLNDPADFVRIEIEFAMKGKQNYPKVLRNWHIGTAYPFDLIQISIAIWTD